MFYKIILLKRKSSYREKHVLEARPLYVGGAEIGFVGDM